MTGKTAGYLLAGACVIGVGLVVWGMRPDVVAGPCVVASRTWLPDLPEASGLAVSRRHPGVIWSHNDSGNAPVLIALDAGGAVRGRVRVPIPARDWEDVSAARCPAGDCLYIADIGDNKRGRTGIRIYRVPEPAPGDAETAPPEVFSAAYTDGAHNAEALFVVGEDLFIVTRDRTGDLYRSTPRRPDSRALTFEPIGQLGLAAVTDAEATPDEMSVVVRTGHELVIYSTADLVRGGAVQERRRIPIDGLGEPQGEGVALGADGLLYLASEGGPWSRAGLFISLRCTWR